MRWLAALVTEVVGFEPTEPLRPCQTWGFSGVLIRCVKPLCHTSCSPAIKPAPAGFFVCERPNIAFVL